MRTVTNNRILKRLDTIIVKLSHLDCICYEALDKEKSEELKNIIADLIKLKTKWIKKEGDIFE